MNVIARLKYELAYYDSAVHHFNHYTTRTPLSIHPSWLAKWLGLLCWGFKGVQEKISSEEASTFQIGSVAFPLGKMHQSTTPSLSQTILPRWASRQFLTLPIVHTLLPVTFSYSLSSEAVVMKQLRWKRLWQRSLTRSHKRTSVGSSRSCWNGRTGVLQPEEITSKGTRVSYVSGNLFNDPRT